MPITITKSEYNSKIIIIKVVDIINRTEWEQYLKDLSNIYNTYSEEGRIYLIWDLTDSELIPLRWMHEHATLLENIKQQTSEYLIASSVIITNSIIRQILNSFFRIYKNKRPVKITKNLYEAIEFVQVYL